jgi:tRNA dimethylallyltransferase
VVGPTASGKTALGIALARCFNGEIINADSRQFYRGMDIGTAKPTAQELSLAAHHLIDVVDPSEVCGLAWFLDHAHAAIRDIRARGRLPIVVGGTGQYVRAMLENWDVPRVPPNEELRRVLIARAERDGLPALVAELRASDPAAAARIDTRNIRRVVRALEVASARGRIVEPPPKREPLGRVLVLGIHVERTELYRRIDARVDAMFAAGLVDEVRSLNARGFGCDLFAFSAIGYREVCGFLSGDLTLDEARDRTKTATHRLARTQAAWFRRSDPRITWLDAGPDLVERAVETTGTFLGSQHNGEDEGLRQSEPC